MYDGAMSAEQDLERGQQLLAAGDRFAALQTFQRAFKAAPEEPRVRSYYGLLHALERGMIQEGLALCADAAARAPELADLHWNLGQVLLKAGRKKEALDAFTLGLERDPNHVGLATSLRELGVRRRPIFPALPRAHP